MLLASDRLSSTAKQAACHGGSAQRGWLWLKATGIHGEPCDPNYQLLVEVRRIIVRVLKSDRTGLTAALRYRFTGPVRPVTDGNRLNSNSNSNKFKNSHATGSDRFDRFTGRFDRFDRWAFMGRPIFFLFLF